MLIRQRLMGDRRNAVCMHPAHYGSPLIGMPICSGYWVSHHLLQTHHTQLRSMYHNKFDRRHNLPICLLESNCIGHSLYQKATCKQIWPTSLRQRLTEPQLGGLSISSITICILLAVCRSLTDIQCKFGLWADIEHLWGICASNMQMCDAATFLLAVCIHL